MSDIFDNAHANLWQILLSSLNIVLKYVIEAVMQKYFYIQQYNSVLLPYGTMSEIKMCLIEKHD